MRFTIVAAVLGLASHALADGPSELKEIPIHLRHRLDALNERASIAGGMYLDVTARAAKPLPPDTLILTHDIVSNRAENPDLPTHREEYLAFAAEMEAVVFDYEHLARDLADAGANALEQHCLRWAEIFRERAATLRQTIAATDAEEKRIAERLEEDPQDYPVRNPVGETSALLRFRNRQAEDGTRIVPENLLMQKLLSKQAAPIWIIVVLVAIGLKRAAPRRSKSERREDREAEEESARYRSWVGKIMQNEKRTR